MADRIGRPRVGAALRSVAFAGSIAIAAGGCAIVSASGTVYETRIPQAGGGQDQGYPQLIRVGPGNGWTASQIVNGFLAAANNYAVARMYLTQSEGASWHPGGAVTVVGDLKPSSTTSEPKLQPDQPEQVTSVSLSGSQLATLTGSGQYLASRSPSSASRRTYTFWLIKIDNNWRITQLPTSQLMLTPDELEQVYQQRNLYFLDLSGHVLVPDPVFVPQNDTNGDLATQLVTGLLKNPQGWLSEAARTALPAGTSLHGSVSINSTDATVSLSVPRAAAKALNERALIAQLVWTLTSTSFGPTAIQSVQVQINDRTLTLNGTPYQLPKLYQNWVPGRSAAAGPYFLSHNGSVKAASAVGQPAPGPDSGGMMPASPVPGQAGTAGIPSLSSIAVEPDQAALAGLSRDGKTVYTAELTRNAVLTAQQPGGTYTSLSWDRNGDLWVAGGTSVWMLAPGTGSAVEISLTDLPAGAKVTSFRVAPDGVRVAMVVENKGEYQVLLGAIINHPPVASIGSQLVAIGAASSYPQSLSWYDADHIIVLTRPGPNAYLTEVPLNGGTFAQPAPIDTVSGTTSVTSDGAGLAVGLPDGELFVSRNLNGPWQQVASSGRNPVYPG
jgi:hypothetical protein